MLHLPYVGLIPIIQMIQIYGKNNIFTQYNKSLMSIWSESCSDLSTRSHFLYNYFISYTFPSFQSFLQSLNFFIFSSYISAFDLKDFVVICSCAFGRLCHQNFQQLLYAVRLVETDSSLSLYMFMMRCRGFYKGVTSTRGGSYSLRL